MSKTIVVIFASLMFLVGLGYKLELTRLFGVSVLLSMLIWELIKGKKFIFPKLFLGYLGILILLGVSIWWSKDQSLSFDYWILFASMPLVWLLSFNNKKFIRKHFFKMFLGLGLAFLVMTIMSQTLPIFSFLKTTPRGLVGAYSMGADHFMLGDLWGVLLIVVLYRYFKSRQMWLLPITGLGMAIMLFSLSRSAILGFVVALMVLFESEKGISARWKRVFWGAVILISLYMSTQKSLLFNRPYYVQAVAGLFSYPWGVGLGNFEIISSDPRFHILGLSGFSRVTHSILLEFMAGMGVLVVFWWGWCVRLYQQYFSKMKVNEYSLALIALVVDMVFNPTYFVTTMWWMFGILLGILGERAEEKWNFLNTFGLVVVSGVMMVGGLFVVSV